MSNVNKSNKYFFLRQNQCKVYTICIWKSISIYWQRRNSCRCQQL